MRIGLLALILILIGGYFAHHERAAAPVILITRPTEVVQGDAVLISVEHLGTTTVAALGFNDKPLNIFAQGDTISALLGIDLKMKSGTYPIMATLTNGQTLTGSVVVKTRAIKTAPLGIPEKLGGNTPEAASSLVNTLADENALLTSLPSTRAALWEDAFDYPVRDPVITDTYGYTRSTVNTSISHKGTDFHAPPGTPVYAMNAGVVILARTLTAYGETIVIDHGAGVQSLYMHLSRLNTSVGDKVTKGQEIGLSGETGYAEGPHLHVSIKIGGISIDPEEFLKLFH